MNRMTTLFAALLVISGCATHTRSSSPVAVVITSNTASANFVKQLRAITLDTIAQQVPNARPMTINMNLDVAATMQTTPAMVTQPLNQQRQLPALSFEPWKEPAPPTVPVNSSVFQTDRSLQITAYHVVYTINDAAGNLVESNELTLDQGHLVDAASHATVKGRDGLVNDTASFLAARVKTLNR
jgi:hypothetical protein